jgi:hypothetical protein
MNRLNFIPTSELQSKFDSEEVAILPSGSRIVRKETRKGRIFQLWLNSAEYTRLKENTQNYHIHFYGGNYVYVGPYAYLSEIIDFIL